MRPGKYRRLLAAPLSALLALLAFAMLFPGDARTALCGLHEHFAWVHLHIALPVPRAFLVAPPCPPVGQSINYVTLH